MKKDNKKALYESIMTSVSKEVKKALNEKSYYDKDVEYVAIEFHDDWHIYHYADIEEVREAYGLDYEDCDEIEALDMWESCHIYIGYDVIIIKVG